MWDFLRKLADVDPEGRDCKDCGYSATSHHQKFGTPLKWDNGITTLKIKRLNCKECVCTKFQ